jgi:hypothetical protein
MKKSDGSQMEFPFVKKMLSSGRNRKTGRKLKDRGGRKRANRQTPMHKTSAERKEVPLPVQEAASGESQQRQALVIFPLRLSVVRHYQWKCFAAKYRYSLQTLIQLCVDEVVKRSVQGEEFPWLD